MMYGYGIGFSPSNRLFSGGGANPLWDGLQAYYAADSTPNDALGTYNGILVEGATYGTGIINQGFSFDGVNDYVSLPDDTFIPSGDFSISMWINISSGNNKYLFQSGSFSPSFKGILLYTNASKMRFWIANNGTINSLDTISNITLNTLQYYTFTFNSATKLMSIYLNGSLENSNTLSVIPSYPSPCPINIGASTVANNYTPGIIDEFALFNIELTSTQVTELYNSGTGKQYPL